jgi:hypothetical protein
MEISPDHSRIKKFSLDEEQERDAEKNLKYITLQSNSPLGEYLSGTAGEHSLLR